MRILLLRLTAIGDVIHALPVLESLRRGLPAAEIHWLVESAIAPVLRDDRRIDRLLVANLRSKKLTRRERAAEFLRIVRELRGERYDLALDLQGLVKSGILARLSGAPRRAGFRDTREWTAPFYTERHPRRGRHVVEMNLGLARAVFPDVPLSNESGLAVGAAGRDFAADYFARHDRGEPRVVVNVGGGWPTKRYPPDLFAAALDRFLERTGLSTVHLLHGPGERDDAVAAAGARGTLIPDNTLPEMIGLLAAADLVVSSDSAPLHVAAALRRPAVGLFGPTSPERNGPFATRATVLVAPVACRGCFRRACPRPPCMRTIPPAALADAMAGLLRRA